MKKRILSALFALLFVVLTSLSVSANTINMQPINEEPMYESFSYTVSEGEKYIVDSPAPYRPIGKINSETLKTALSSPSDIDVTENGIYISDKTENCVIHTDADFNVKKVFKGFLKNGKEEKFSEPLGISAANGKLYIADSGNKRIVVLDENGDLVSIIERPESTLLSESLDFVPQKLDVDGDGRIYVIVKGVYEGIMEFYEDGSFGGFVGSIPVDVDPITALWKKLLSKEQSQKLERFIPVEYTNISLDKDGFIYTVSLMAENQDNIRRLNASGSDILIRDSLGGIDISGAILCSNVDNSDEIVSNLVDIMVDENDLYYVLDSQYGRIFTYDNRGNMLFSFGGLNNSQNGSFGHASAMALIGNILCVADGESGTITLFERTDYANAIFTATALYGDDKYNESIDAWNDVLQYNGNFTLAYSMIGKAFYQLGNYSQSMEYYKKAANQSGYSKAFEVWRDNLYSKYFIDIVIGIVLIIAVIITVSVLLKRRRSKTEESKVLRDLKYPFYVIFHPFDGFWDLKYEKRGRAWISTLLIILTIVAMTLERSLSGFAVSSTPGYKVDIVYQLKLVLVPLALFIISNMSITTLMDGKGSFKDLYIASGYVLLPFAFIKLPLTLFSNLLTQTEAVYVTLLNAIAIIWVVFLLFCALMSLHEYTPGKTVATMIFTVIAMVIICFICVLFFSLFSELVGFLYTLFREMLYR